MQKKLVGPWMLTLMVLGNTVGAGIFLMPSSLASIGSISMFGWILAALATIGIVFVFSKLLFIHKIPAGPYVYIKESFGHFMGYKALIIYAIATWTLTTEIAVAVTGYLSAFFPLLSHGMNATLSSIALVWFFIFISFLGPKVIATIQSSSTLFMIIAIMTMALFGWFWFDVQMFEASWSVADAGAFIEIDRATTLTMLAFTGIETAFVIASISRDPEHDVLRATIAAVIIATFMYILSSAVLFGILNAEELAHSAAPFSDAARKIWGEDAAFLMNLSAFIACFGTLGGWVLVTTEVNKKCIDQEVFPKFMRFETKQGVPLIAMFVIGGVISVILLVTVSDNISEQFAAIAQITVFCFILINIYSAVALLVLFKRKYGSFKKLYLYVGAAFFAIIMNLYVLHGMDDGVNEIGIIITLLITSFYFFIISYEYDTYRKTKEGKFDGQAQAVNQGYDDDKELHALFDESNKKT